MAFSLNIANAPSLGDWFNPGELNPRVLDQDQAPHPILNARNASTTAFTAGDSVNMFLDAFDEDYEFAASIVTACEDRTVYALQCTSAPRDIFTACGPDGPIVTITAGTDYYEVGSTYVATTLGYTGTISLDETCTLNTAAATCTATVGGEAEGIATSLTRVVTLASPSYYRFDVAITGGAEKTKSSSPSCGAEGTATSSSSKGTATSSSSEGAATSSSSKVTATSSSSEDTATSNNSEGAATSLNAKSMAIWALTGTFGVAGLLTML